MDLFCRFCGEPWDHDELHTMIDGNDRAVPYARAAARFKRLGCGAFESGSRKCSHATVDPDRAARARVLQDVSSYAEEWIDD